MAFLPDVTIGDLKVVLVIEGRRGEPASAARMAAGIDGIRACVVHEVDEGPPGVAEVLLAWADEGRSIDVEALTGGRAATGYIVEERPQWDHAVGPDGVTRISFVRRRPDLTRERFADHWTNVHAALARRHHPALWRYVQNVVVAPLTPDAPEIDGIAELGFRSIEDMWARMYDSPEGAAVIRADVDRFIDAGAGWRVLTRPSLRATNP
jgi:uncharacterized protein (TIGR02118 family)